MSIDVATEIEINKRVPEVASFAANPANVTKWYGRIKSVEWKTSHPLRVGTRIAFIARFLGRKLAYTYEVLEYVPNDRLVMRTQDGPFPMETTYTWKPAELGGTRMTVRKRGIPNGLMLWFKPLVAIAVGLANRRDLARLKSILEQSTT